MESYFLEEQMIKIFNQGAFRLHFFDYEDLHLTGYTFLLDAIIDKAGGKNNEEKYLEIRRKSISLFTKIRDKILVGHFYTPRTLLLNWEFL